jgi:hypothetical protein
MIKLSFDDNDNDFKIAHLSDFFFSRTITIIFWPINARIQVIVSLSLCSVTTECDLGLRGLAPQPCRFWWTMSFWWQNKLLFVKYRLGVACRPYLSNKTTRKQCSLTCPLSGNMTIVERNRMLRPNLFTNVSFSQKIWKRFLLRKCFLARPGAQLLK